MRKWSVFLFASFVAIGAIGCGGDGGPEYEIAAGTLSGKHDGKAWKFVTGNTDDFLSDEEGFFTKLYDVEADTCGFGADTAERTILLQIPTTEGQYELGLKNSVTFAYDQSQNDIATTGSMVVEKITADTVDVGLYAIFNDDPNFEVSGHFTANICPAQ